MCKSMSAKRCLLIAAILGVVVLSAKITSWIYCSSYHLTTSASKSLTGYDLNKIVNVPLGKVNLEFDNRLVYTDKPQADRRDKLTIKPQISLSHKWDNGFAKVFYRGEYFNNTSNSYRDFFPDETKPLYANRTYNQQVGGKLTFDDESVYGSLASRHRTFFYNSLLDSEPTILETNNINTSFTMGYRVLKPISVFVTGNNKQALDDKSDLYNYASGRVGVTLDNPVPFGIISAQSRVEWLTGKQLSLDLNTTTYAVEQTPQRLIPVTSEFRYTVMPTQQIMGFVSYANRSFYDREGEEMLFNSHFLRTSGKYSFLYDASNASFVEIGTKYAPGDEIKYKSSNYFARAEMKVIDKLYLGTGFNSMPERLTKYEGIARYYFSPWNEVFVNFIHTEDPEFNKVGNYTAVGVRMMF